MREPRNVDRITAPYDMPGVINESAIVDDAAEKNIKIVNVESAADVPEEIVLVTTANTTPSEMTIDLDLDEDDNGNDSKAIETDKSAKKMIDAHSVDKVVQQKTLNGASDGSTKTKSGDKSNADVSSQNEHAMNKNETELMNGVECESDDAAANHLDSNNEPRSSTESLEANDNGTVESNVQRTTSKAATTTTATTNKTTATTTATKSNKRKISISSEDDQPPPAKK